MANVIYATGGTGPLNTKIAWFNFGTTNINVGTTLTFANSIPNVGNISWSIYNATTSGSASVVAAAIAPFATGYSGQVGNSVIRFQGTTAVSTMTFNNILLTDLSGNPLNKRYNIVAVDGELTGTIFEYNQWITNGSPWTNLVTIPVTATPASNISGNGTQILLNTGNSAGGTYITPVAISQNATQIIYTAKPNSGEGTGLGILIDQIATSKQVNTNSTGIGQILTYTIPVTNISFDTLSSISLVDTLPDSVSFIPGTFVVDGQTQPNPTFPNTTLADIASGATSTVVFKVRVIGTNPNPIVNSAFVSGLQGTYPNNGTTNSVTTTINFANLITTKAVDKIAAIGGDTLTYTITLANNGNTTANSVIITDTIPATTTFKAGSVTGATGTPPTLTVGTIGPGKISTVTFAVIIATVPNNPILNNSTTNYFYYANGGTTGTTIPDSVVSNQVSTTTASATISSMSKIVSESYGTLGDVLTYSVSFTNTGNDTATNIIFLDTIPTNTTFNSNSLYINNIQQLGLTPNPPGVSVPNLGAGQTATIKFDVTVTTVPTLNPIKNQGVLSYAFAANTSPNGVLSNQVATTINYSSLSSSKIVSKNYANIGDVLTYTIPISNSGNTTANSILFLDTLPNGTSLVQNSFKQDGIIITGTPNISVTLPNSIRAGGISTVTFQVTVTTIPVPNPIQNIASAKSSFIIDGTTTPNKVGITSTNTNAVNTQINFASLGKISKSVDKSYATCGESINYIILIPNTGNVTAQNVILKDTIPNGTILIPTTVYVNGVAQSGINLSTGITIPNIAPGTTATVTFSVQVQC